MSAAPISEKEWNAICTEVTNAMTPHVQNYTAALQRIVSHDLGESAGTGTYLSLRGKTYMLTNAHVAELVLHGGLSHQPRDGDYAHRLIHPFLAMDAPVDTAISRIDDESWRDATKLALPAHRIARRHSTVDRTEMLFISGFPGERTRWSALAGGPITRSVPYLTQEAPLPEGLDPRLYFALHYNPELARSVDGKSVVLPRPFGFSGTLVWNTRFIERSGSDWSPEDSVATGLICEWGQGEHANIILAIRIEVVRMMLLLALRQESAYFRWLERIAKGAPGDALSDWLAAEAEIDDLV